MRNRWFHVPVWHTPTHEKKVSWLELFYDLIFVAAFIQLGNGLSDHVGVLGFLKFCAVFLPMWIVWTGFTFYHNRFTIDDFTHRLMIFAKMFAVGAMAVTAAPIFENQPAPFALAFAFAQGVVALLYWRSYHQQEEGKAYCRYWGTVFAIGGALWFFSALLPEPWCYVIWALGLLTIFGAPFSRHSRALAEQFSQDNAHLAERYGLLTIIVLGESFVKVLSSVNQEGGSLGAMTQASLALLITCCIWWIYFDDVAGSEIKKKPLAPMIWLYGHLPLHISITALGVAVKKIVAFDLATPAPEKYRWFLCATLGLVFLSTAAIDSVTQRRQAELSDRARVNVRFFSGVLVLLLAVGGRAMSAAWFLAMVSAICVAQVLFDMLMAPLEALEHHGSVADTGPEFSADSGSNLPGDRRSGLDAAVRMGTPSALRKDFYFYFMEGSWYRTFLALIVFYLVVNGFFALLYLLQPGSVAEAHADSFADAFFFSVQTMSTIGYGSLTPATTYGHIIVTIEAAVGLLGVALATGLMFAKASKPKSSLLFSRNLVIAPWNGINTLMFRVGNARGTELADANITVSALCNEISTEGNHMRKISDLALVRSRTPFFSLSWTVMHLLDESSPMHGIDWSVEQERLISLVVTLTGHDGTYGQMVYDRHEYFPEDVLPGRYFADVLSRLPDGRLMINYHRFHETRTGPAEPT